jgi:hypothetical protein
MNKWMRRIRGAIGMGLAWAAAWFGAGMVMMLGFLLITGSTGADVPYPLGFGLFGFLGGVLFSGFLGVAEGRRRFEEMSLPRFALWGGAGGLLLAVIFVFVAGLGGEALLLGSPVRSGRCGLRFRFPGPGQDGGDFGLPGRRHGGGQAGACRRSGGGAAWRWGLICPDGFGPGGSGREVRNPLRSHRFS